MHSCHLTVVLSFGRLVGVVYVFRSPNGKKMQSRFRCNECKRLFKTSPSSEGRWFTCPDCESKFVINLLPENDSNENKPININRTSSYSDLDRAGLAVLSLFMAFLIHLCINGDAPLSFWSLPAVLGEAFVICMALITLDNMVGNRRKSRNKVIGEIMPIRFRCKHCSTVFQTKRSNIDSWFECPQCNGKTLVTPETLLVSNDSPILANNEPSIKRSENKYSKYFNTVIATVRPPHYVIIVGALLLVFSLLFPPWLQTTQTQGTSKVYSYRGLSFIFNPPEPDRARYNETRGVEIDLTRLFIQVLVICILTGLLWFVLEKLTKKPSHSADSPSSSNPT